MEDTTNIFGEKYLLGHFIVGTYYGIVQGGTYLLFQRLSRLFFRGFDSGTFLVGRPDFRLLGLFFQVLVVCDPVAFHRRGGGGGGGLTFVCWLRDWLLACLVLLGC